MRITVEVKTSSRKEVIDKLDERYYRVEVKAPPRKGKANKAIISLLKDYFGKPVWIVGGHRSKVKYVEVEE